MGVTLDKVTPGTSALAEALADAGDGYHLAHMSQWSEWGCTAASVKVLTLLGVARGAEYTWAGMGYVGALIDAAMHRGIGTLTLFTDTPRGRTVESFHIEGGEILTMGAFIERKLAGEPQALREAFEEQAHRDRVDLLNFESFERAEFSPTACRYAS